MNVSVETNAPGGADLYLSMANSTNALHLNGDTTSTAPAIEATASSVASNALAANTWGYSTNDQTYSAVPTSNSDPALLAAVDGSSVGSNAGGVITASIPNRLAYSAVVDGGIITEATLTKIEIDGAEVDTMQPEVENTLTVTTNLMTNTYGAPRVYLETTDPSGYQECGSVVVSRNESGYMTITCKVTPTQAATDVTLHIVPKGSSDDRFCTDGTYTPDTSDCEAGEWKWGSFVIGAPDIVEVKTLTDITYMQEMTPEICNASVENETKRLIDSRDGKYYWVAKLKDENCWMTQNLDFDIPASGLTSKDSDVSNSWDSSSAYPPRNTEQPGIFPDTNDGDTGTYSWDRGMYVKSDPSDFDASCSRVNDLSDPECVSAGWIEVSNMVPMEDSSVAEAVSGNSYNAHYLIGNLYQWNAATAGTGAMASGSDYDDGRADAVDSICPKGWKLPNYHGSQVSGSLYYLVRTQYGLTGPSGSAAATQAPLYLIPSGYVYADYHGLESVGSFGAYWSSTSTTSPFDGNAHGLYMTSGGLVVGYSSITYGAYSGQAVRCIAGQ